MQYDYFYGAQAEQFSFYRIPKALFTDAQFKDLSTDAKVLYGILLDRMSLSLKNHWLDEQNRVYIIFTLGESPKQIFRYAVHRHDDSAGPDLEPHHPKPCAGTPHLDFHR